MERWPLRVGSHALALLAAAILLGWGAEARAQPAPATSAAKPAKEKEAEKPVARAQAVERAEPDILYVLDGNGKEYVPLINRSLEEISRALLALDGGPTAISRPRYRLKSLNASGTVERDHAVLRIELEIDASDENWVRVPLRLGGIVLDQPPKVEGEGQHLLDYESASHEYVAWFRGTTQKPRRVVLHALTPIERQGGQATLRLNAPRAVTSQLTLTVPLAEATGEVSKDSVLAETRQVDGATEFHITGLSGDFSIAWQKPDQARNDSPAILSVDGQVVAQVDGRGIRTSAALRVNAFGREFSNFNVRLPRGATLLPDTQAEYSIVPVEAVAGEAAGQEPQVVEVRLKNKTSGPLLVKLVTDQGHDVTRGGSFELGGFEVLGAVRQYGYLAVQVKDDWQVTFGPRQGVQQSEDLPAEMPREDVVAGFVYYGQPYSLPARITPLQTRTSADSTFRLAVGPRQLTLDATFKYHVAGAKVFWIEFDLADWTLDETTLGPPGLVKTAGLVVGQGSPVLVPLQQAATGELELTFKARRPIAADARSIDVRFPRAVADSFGGVDLSIVPDENVVLAPRAAESAGLVVRPPSALDARSIPDDNDGPWPRRPAMSYRADTPDARFVADFHLAARTIAARVMSRVKLSGTAAKVDQTLSYTIANEPAEALVLEAPAELVQAEPIVVKLAGQPLKVERIDEDPSETGMGVRLRVRLPEPRLGECELTTSYEWPGDGSGELPSLATARVEIPLVMPGDRECSSNEAMVTTAAGLHAEPLGKLWVQVDEAKAAFRAANERTRAERETTMRLTAAGACPQLTMAVRLDEEPLIGAFVVERALLTSRFSAHVRQDRGVYRFSTAARRIALRLPEGATGARYWLKTDAGPRREITREVSDRNGERIINLAPASWYVLDLSYDVPRPSLHSGRQAIELPRLVGQVSLRRGYWQVTLPPDEFLLAGPADWTPEFVWQRRFLAWFRRPLVESLDLNRWVGAPGDDVSELSAGDRYLFSTIEPRVAFDVWTMRRSLLVLTASGLVLALGLVWLYWPAARRPVWLFAAGVATLSVAGLWPDAALVWLQAAVLGGLLAMTAVALERAMTRPRRPAAPYRGASSSIIRPASTHTQLRVPSVATPVSTETAVVVESQVPEAAP